MAFSDGNCIVQKNVASTRFFFLYFAKTICATLVAWILIPKIQRKPRTVFHCWNGWNKKSTLRINEASHTTSTALFTFSFRETSIDFAKHDLFKINFHRWADARKTTEVSEEARGWQDEGNRVGPFSLSRRERERYINYKYLHVNYSREHQSQGWK